MTYLPQFVYALCPSLSTLFAQGSRCHRINTTLPHVCVLPPPPHHTKLRCICTCNAILIHPTIVYIGSVRYVCAEILPTMKFAFDSSSEMVKWIALCKVVLFCRGETFLILQIHIVQLVLYKNNYYIVIVNVVLLL